MSSTLQKDCAAIFHALRRINRESRQKRAGLGGGGAGLTEAHVLMEVQADPEVAQREIAERINLEKSSLSRAVAGLVAKEWLKKSASPTDARRNVMHLTALGQQVLDEMDRRGNAHVDSFLTRLSDAEQTRFTQLMLKLTTRANEPAPLMRPDELPLRAALRAITRQHGYLGGAYMGSDCSALEWQLMSELKYGGGPAPSQELGERLGVPRNSLARALQDLESRGCVSRSINPNDRRSNLVSFTAGGGRMLRKIEALGQKVIASAAAGLTAAERRELVRLIERYSGRGGDAELLAPGLILKRIEGGRSLAAARGFLLVQLVRAGRQEQAAETVMGAASSCWGLYSKLRHEAVVEFGRADGVWRLLNFAAAPSIESSAAELDFLRRSLQQFFAAEGAAELRLEPGALPQELARRVKPKRSGRSQRLLRADFL